MVKDFIIVGMAWFRKNKAEATAVVSAGASRGSALSEGLERLGFDSTALLGGAFGGGTSPQTVVKSYPILSTSQGAHAVQLNQLMCSGVAVECFHRIKMDGEMVDDPCDVPEILEYPCFFDESIDLHSQTAEAVFAGILCGEIFIWKELDRSGRKVLAWWVLSNSKVTIERRRGAVFYRVSGSDIAGDPPAGVYTQKNIMHIVVTPIAGYRRGMGASQLATLPVAMAVLNNVYGNAAFQNATDIKGYWELQDATPEQVVEFRDKLDEAKGAENAAKDIVASSKAAFKALNPEPSRMQMVSARQRSGIEMSQVTHTNATQVGEVQQGSMSYAIADAHDVQHTKNIIQPILAAIERAFNRDISTAVPRILPRGTFMRYNLDHLLRGDERSRAVMLRGLVKDGIFAPNEARAALDQRPHPNEDADDLIAPSNWGPLGDLMEQQAEGGVAADGDEDRSLLEAVLQRVAALEDAQAFAVAE